MKIELTAAEVSHLLTLLKYDEKSGSYWGNKGQYWARAKRIEEKLVKAVKE